MSLLYANDRPGTYPDSFYAAKKVLPAPRPALQGDIRADVCVIGGGYTGLSAALHLARTGADVVLLEAHRPGWGASGRNGGQVGSGQRIDAPEMKARFGIDRARALWSLGQEANALVKALIAEGGIDCALKPGIAYVSLDPAAKGDYRRYADAMARDFGYEGLTYLDTEATRAEIASEAYHCGVLDAGGAHLDPLAFALGLSRMAEEAGARLFDNSPVVAIERGATPVARTAHGSVRADHLIVACNGYVEGLLPEASAHSMPINNFIAATEPLPDAGRELIPNDIAVADSKFVVNYFRLSPDGRLLFGGGENYSYRFPSDIREFVRGPMARIFPQIADIRLDYGWGGTLAITRSRLPYLRRIGETILTAGGYSGHGVALATFSGKLMADAIRGRSDGFETMAAIPAKPFPGGRAMRWPLLVLAMSWYAMRDRL